MSLLATAAHEVYGLLVEDGQLALGTLVAFGICAVVSLVAGAIGSTMLRNAVGPLLFVLLMGLLLTNVYAAAKRTR
jgi:hypothetical protein